MRRRQRRRLAGLARAVCGLSLVVGCTSDAVDPAGQDRPYGPQPEDSAAAWPGTPGVELAGQSSRWWPVASARDLSPTGIDVVASSHGVGEMVVDGAGVVWIDIPWGLVRLDPASWSASAWDVGHDAAFVSNWSVRASAASGVWLVEEDRVRLFDGDRFVRDIQVPSEYLGGAREGDEGIRDLVEVGSELWIASEDEVARCDGRTWSQVGEGELNGVESLQLTPWGEVWAGSLPNWGRMQWMRYDGIGWRLIDTPHGSVVHTIAWDPTGGIVAASGLEVVRYDGSTWQTMLRLDEDEAEGDEVETVAASRDGTVWALTGGALLRSDDDGDWYPVASSDGTPLTGLAVSGDEVVVSSDVGVHRVVGDQLELVWSSQERWAVVPDLMDVVTVSGDEAWIVVEEWSEERDAPTLYLQRVQVGRPDPILVGSLPASAVSAYWGWLPSALGTAAVAASDGAIWYVTDEAVVRIADGTESVVASGLGDYLVGGHRLNVNVVAMDEGGPERADPRPREIGPDGFAELTVTGEVVEQTLYGDGDITCPDHWAHDLSLPVGRVQYTPTPQAVEITVTLDRAWPDTDYYVEVNTDQFCLAGGSADPREGNHFVGLTTDRDGAGSLTLTHASRPPDAGARLLAGDDGAVWLLPTARLPWWFADPEEGGRNEQADWEGLCLLTPEGECTTAELPAPTRDIMSLVGGPGGNLWATVCEAGTQPGGWGEPMCSAGRQLMRWEAGWTPVAYPGADVTGLGAAPDGGIWGILAEETGQFEKGILAHYREGSWTTFPEFTHAQDDYYDPDAYAVTPAGSVCRIDGEGPTLICVDTSLRISRTPVGVAGNVAVAADGAVWVEGDGWLARAPITVP